MNEETDQLTVNVEADPPGYRPAKKKKVAKKVPKKPGTAGKKVGKKTAAVPSPKVPSSGKKSPKKVPTKKAGKPAARPGAGGVVTVGARGAKKMGKSTGQKSRITRSPSPSSGATVSTASKKAGKPGKSVGKTAAPKKPSRTRTSDSNKLGKSGAGKTPKPSRPSSAGSRVKSPASSIDPSTLKPDRLYGITRINQPHKGNLGWWLRIGPKGSRHDQFFADKKSGGEAKAFKLAVAKRNELYAGLPLKLKIRGAIKRKVAAA